MKRTPEQGALHLADVNRRVDQVAHRRRCQVVPVASQAISSTIDTAALRRQVVERRILPCLHGYDH
jgi:hypothetical protein